MKALLLIDSMEMGGAETHVEALARGLSRMGVAVTVLSSGGRIADRLEASGIPQIKLPLLSRNPWNALRLRGVIRRLVKREKYDILHAHTRFSAFLIRGRSADGCRELMTVHAKFEYFPFLRRLCHRGTYTVAVSEDLRRYAIKACGVPSERIRVIPNGIDCRRFSPSPTLQNAPRVLFASRLDTDCALGAELLCTLAPELNASFPALAVDIIGGGEAYAQIKLLSEAANRTVGREMIRLCGTVEDPAALMQACTVFVGVSRAAMEAAACGAAVILCGNEGYLGILSPDTACAARLTNFCARQAPSATKEALQRDLISLLSDEKTRIRYAYFAKTLIRTHYTEEEMCRRTLALYHRAARPRQDRRIVIGGYFGCGNLGDDAILLGTLEALHELAPSLSVTCLTGNARRDRRRFDAHTAGRKNPFAILLSLLRADAFLCGGGSLLQNATGNRSLAYYLALLRISHICHAKTVLFAAGIGPLYGKKARRRTFKFLSRLPYISLRDEASFDRLERAGIDRSQLHLGADPALLMPLPPPTRKAAILSEHGLSPESAYFCVVLKGGHESIDTRRILVASARILADRHGLLPIYLIFDRRHDKKATHIAQKSLHGYQISLSDPADAAAILSGANITLTMRLHAMILSSAVTVPAIGIPSDPGDQKIPAFARASAQDFIPREELTVAALVECAENALADAQARRPLLRAGVADLRKKVQKDLANIVTMLYNKNQND